MFKIIKVSEMPFLFLPKFYKNFPLVYIFFIFEYMTYDKYDNKCKKGLLS